MQDLYCLRNPAAVGGCRPRLLGRDSNRLSGAGVRGLSVPLMLLASYLWAKLSESAYSTRQMQHPRDLTRGR
jgi:hypothetical protein